MLLAFTCALEGQKSNIFIHMFEYIAYMDGRISFQVTFKKSFHPLFLDAIMYGLQNILIFCAKVSWVGNYNKNVNFFCDKD